MEPLVFSMLGEVRGKGRPRTTVRGGFARVFTDAKTRTYEQSVASVAKAAMRGRTPFQGPLSVSIQFRLAPPKSMTKKLRAAVLAGEEAYFGRVDLDNAAKSILDGCNGVVFKDDVQITRMFLTKLASETPGVDIKVQPLAPQPGEQA